MPISLDEVVISPQIQAKEYPYLWIYNLIIHAPSPTSARATIEYYPMAADGELYVQGGVRKLEAADFFKCLQEVPEVALAYQAVMASIMPMKAWIEKPVQVEPAPEVVQEPEVIGV